MRASFSYDALRRIIGRAPAQPGLRHRKARATADRDILYFEALEQRILLSADHNVLAGALAAPGAIAAPRQVDAAATTKAAFLDAQITPAATDLGAQPVLQGAQIENRSFSGDTSAGPDSFTVDVATGQTIAVLVDPATAGFAGSVSLADPGNTVVASQTGTGPLLLDPVTAAAGGTYTVTVSATAGAGAFTATVGLNAVIDANIATHADDYHISSLDPSDVALPNGGDRMGAIGQIFTKSNGDLSVDGFDVTATKGQVLDIVAAPTSTTSRGVLINVFDDQGHLLANGVDNAAGGGQALHNFVAPADGVYTVNVFGAGETPQVDYNLVVTRSAGFAGDSGQAAVLSPSGNAIGHLDSVAPDRTINVAVVGSAGANAIADQLNADTQFSFNATALNFGSIASVQDLAPFDVVVVADAQYAAADAGLGPSDTVDPLVQFGNVVAAWEQAGGGLVTMPFSAFGAVASNTTFAAELPVTTSSETTQSNAALTFATSASPVTANLSALSASEVDVANLASGATALATVGGQAAVAVGVANSIGRSVYLGLNYTDTSTANLRRGAADRLLQQAVAYAAAGHDGYTVSLNAGDMLEVNATALARNGDGSADTLLPTLALAGPDGTVLALTTTPTPGGQNTPMSFTADTAGLYHLTVGAADDTAGDYELSATGATGTIPLVATAVTPSDLAVLDPASPPASVQIQLSEPVLQTTLSAGALTLNGVAATAVSDDGNALYTFTVDPAAVHSGSNTVAMAAGAVTGIDGQPLSAFTSHFAVGYVAPTVLSSSITNGQIVAAADTITDTITFSEPMQVSDLSSITLTNTQSGATYTPTSVAFDAATNAATFTYAALPPSVANAYALELYSGSVHDIYGNDLAGGSDAYGDFITHFTVANTAPVAVPLVAAGVTGSQVHAASLNGAFPGANVNNDFTFTAVAGQTFSAALTQTAGLGVTLSLRDAGGAVVATTSGTGDLALQNVALTTGGGYTLRAVSTTGSAVYGLVLALNATADGGDGHATPATALDITGSARTVATGADRLAVSGTLDAAADPALYAFTLAAGQSADLALSASGTNSPVTFDLLNASGTRLATSGSSGLAAQAVIANVTAPAAGTYYVRVNGPASVAFTLAVTRGAQLALAPSVGEQAITSGAIVSGLRAQGGYGPVRVAVFGDTSAASVAAALNADGEYRFVATAVAGTDIDTLAKLSAYDVVLFSDSNSFVDAEPFLGALKTWVQSGAGNVVATGDVVHVPSGVSAATAAPYLADLNAILPVTVTGTYGTGYISSPVVISDPAQPIVTGLTAAALGSTTIGTLGLAAGATAVASWTPNAITYPVVATSGGGAAGRSAYIGNYSLQGSEQLLQQALAYAANVGDEFTVSLTAGTPAAFTTQTPATGTSASALAPTLTLLNPDGSVAATNTGGAPDGKNAKIAVTPGTSGTYRLRITGAPGDFVLNATGVATAAAAPFSVLSTTPGEGAAIQTAPEPYRVVFSAAVDLSTLQASDFTINGAAATGFAVVDGQTVDFDTGTKLAAEGTYTLAIAAGAVRDISGAALGAFSTTLRVDRTPPTVVSTSLDAGSVNPASTLSVAVTFSEAIDPSTLYATSATATDTATNATAYGSSVSYDAQSHTATYVFNASNGFDPTREDPYTFQLSYFPTDLAGNELNGDGSGAGSTFSRSFKIDNTLLPLPVLTAAALPGSMVSSAVATGGFYGAGDVDAFSVTLPAGDTVGLRLTQTSGNSLATLALVDAGGTVVATATAASAGAAVPIPTSPALASGTYTVRLTDGSGSGRYQLQVVTNALLDADAGGVVASLLPTAQTLPGGGDRLAATGTLGSAADSYTFTLTLGQTASLALTSPAAAFGTLTLLGPDGHTVVATGSASSEAEQAIQSFTATAAGTYTVKVSGTDTTDPYTLVVTRGVAFDAQAGQSLALGSSVLGGLGIPYSAGRPVRVAIYGSTAGVSTYVAQLNADAYGQFQAVQITPGQITSAAQLAAYDVVMLLPDLSNTVPAFGVALHQWVTQDGGGVVAQTGIYYWQNATDPDIEAVLPLQLSTGYFGQLENFATVIQPTSPIVQNVSFPGGFSTDYGYASPAAGATVVVQGLSGPTEAIVATANPGLGRSVFIGSSDTRLLEQALTYAASAHTVNGYAVTLAAGSTVAFTTATPTAGGAAGTNRLAPSLALVAPDGTVVAAASGNAADGQNADLVYAVPAGAAGAYRLRVVDATGTAGAYVLHAATSTVTPVAGTPAVAPTRIDAPASLTTEQPADVYWDVTNSGTAVVEGAWTDQIYASTTPTLGAGAVLVGSATHAGTLGIGQDYTGHLQLVLPPAVAAGPLYLILKTSGPDTNPATQTIASTPVTVSSDAVVTVTTPPTEVFAGVASSVGFTVTAGPNAGFGYYAVTVFLTSNPNNPLAGAIASTPTVSVSLGAGQSGAATASFTVPSLPTGTYYVAVEVANATQVRVGVATRATIVDRITVSSVVPPATAVSGQGATVSWTLTNPGTSPTTGPITDTVYLSTDPAGTNLSASAGSFTYSGALTGGQSVMRTQTIVPPALPVGQYYVVVVTSYGSASSMAVASTPTALLQTVPNLVVSSITPPSSLYSSQPATIDWVVSNTGTASTSATGWVDKVYLSTATTVDSNAILLGTVANPSYLDAGQSYASSLTATLPPGISGNYNILVVTDATNQVFENLNEDDNTTVAPVTITLTPPPDLQVTTVTGPTTAFSGQPATVSWTVANKGLGSTIATFWVDDVYVSATPGLDGSSVFLGSVYHSGAIDAAASYSASTQVTLPIGKSGPFYFVVTTDADNDVYEQAFEGNNTTASTTATDVQLTPPPDLVTTITAAPATGAASHTVTLSYTVSNDGSTTTPNLDWTDGVYLSTSSTFDATATEIGSLPHEGALAPGDSYQETVTDTVPDGISGSYYLFVKADTANAVFEVDKTNNVAASPIALTSDPAALAVTTFTAPSTGATGRQITVSWSVDNLGGDTVVENFPDTIVLTQPNSSGLPVSTTIGTFYHTGVVQPGGTYTNTQTVTLPYIAAGNYTLSVEVDSDRSAYEAPGTNSTASTPFALTAAGPDLAVTAVTAPATTEAGTPLTIAWTTTNVGDNATDANFWYDDVYVSTKQTLDGTATLLGTRRTSSALAAGGSYAGTLTTSLPIGLGTGTYYILVQTDAPTGVLEATQVTDANRANNIRASAGIVVTANPAGADKPDLAVTAISADPTAVSGQDLDVHWTVTNVGSAPASQAGYDAVYLSLDATLDKASDIYLGSYDPYGDNSNAPTLAPGAAYSVDEAYAIPKGLSGPYYVFVDADAGGQNATDPNAANNTGLTAAPTQISLPTPVDLAVGTITVPASAIAGTPASFTYTVSNNAGTAAVGSWTDALYLSSTGTFAATDPLLGTIVHEGGVAAHGSYTATLTVPLPGVTPGEYTVIVRSNILDSIPETTLANNIAASLDSTSIDVPALTLGTPVTGTLSAGQALYYKVTVPAGDTLQFALSTSAAYASSAVYVKYGVAPTPNDFDQSASTPFTGVQTVTVPTTQAGTYYVEVLGQSYGGAYSLSATEVPFSVTSVAAASVGNLGISTLKITGARFDADTQFGLLGADGTQILAAGISIADASTAYVSFDFGGVAAQSYELVAFDGVSTAVDLPNAVTVTPGQGFVLSVTGTTPSAIRVNTPAIFALNYANAGDEDMAAPLIIVSSDQALTFGIGNAPLTSGPLFVLGASEDGPADVLRPGDAAGIGITYEASIGQHYRYTINTSSYVFTDTGYAISDADWATIEGAVRPAGLTDAQWTPFWTAIKPQLGTSWGGLDSALNTIMDEVSPAGAPIRDVRALFAAMYAIGPTYLPTVTVSGRLLGAADGTTPIANTEVAAYLENADGTLLYGGVATTDASGAFSIAGLDKGTYEFAIVGNGALLFDQNRDGQADLAAPTVTLAGANVSNVTLFALADSDPASNSAPILIDDSAGNAYLFWTSDSTLWSAEYDGTSWVDAAAVTGTTGGSDFAVAASDKLVDGTQSGLIVTFTNGDGTTNGSDINYVIGERGTGGLNWSQVVQLTTDPVADSSPTVAVGNDGKIMVVYAAQDLSINENAHLYFKQVTASSSSLTFTSAAAAEVAAAQASLDAGITPAGLPPLSGDYHYKFEVKDVGLPFIGKVEKASIQAGVTKSVDGLKGTLKGDAGIDITFETLERAGNESVSTAAAYKASFQGTWMSNNACDNPQWNFDNAQVEGSGSISPTYKVPLHYIFAGTGIGEGFATALAVFSEAGLLNETTSFGLTFGLTGTFTWKGNLGPIVNKDIPPDTVAATINLGASIKAEISAGKNNRIAEGTGVFISGELADKVTVNPDGTLSFGQVTGKASMGLTLKGLGGHGIAVSITYDGGSVQTSIKLSDADVLGAADDSQGGTVSIDVVDPPAVGIGAALYTQGGAAALDPTTAATTLPDSAASTVVAPDGTIWAAWAEGLPDGNAENAANVIMVSRFDGTAWSTPVEVAGSVGSDDAPVLSLDQHGDVMLVFSHIGSVTLPAAANGPISTAFLQAYQAALQSADMDYSVFKDGSWSTAQKIAELPQADDRPSLGLAGGQLYATWINEDTTGTNDTVEVASWNGTGWSTPTAMGSGTISDNPAIGSAGGAPTLFWSQETLRNDGSQLNTLYSSTFSGGSWSAAAAFTPGTPAQTVSATSTGGSTGSDTSVATTTPIQTTEDPLADTIFGAAPNNGQQNCDKNPMDPKKPKPPNGGGGSGGGTGGQSNSPGDPNDMLGPAGYGLENYVSAASPLNYTIEFENEPTASAAAQQVVITQQLDPALDPRSFRLTGFGFGSTLVALDGTQAFYQGTIDLSATKGYDVDVTAAVDVTTGIVTWTFATIDPATGQAPTSPDVGFLPLDNAAGDGEGFVSYSVKAKSTDTSGTVVSSKARITFDTQEPMDTVTVTNALDVAPPTSKVTALPTTETSPNFTLSFTGTDEAGGSAIASYAIYVSEDGGAFSQYEHGLTGTSTTFNGEVGHTYAFYSQATDNAGNVEAPHVQADTSTTVLGAPGTLTGTVFQDVNGDGTQGSGDTGLGGFTVFLDTNGNGVYDTGEASAVTAADGSYGFAGIPAGLYKIGLEPRAGFVTTTGTGDVDATVISGATVTAPAFGVFQTITIAGTVFNDPNASGVRDAGESGLAGWTVYLDKDNSGTLTAGDVSTVTLADGSYSFTGLGPGHYIVREVLQPHYAVTGPAAGFFTVTAASGVNVTGEAFGDVALASVTGTVYEDVNGDGQRETGEPGLAGWTVFLDANGNGTLDNGERSTVTAADGSYSIADVLPGHYTVGEVAPAGWVVTAPGPVVSATASATPASAAAAGSDVQLVLPEASTAAVASDSLDPDNQLAASLAGLDTYRADPRFAAYDGTGLSVAVIDTGIDASSPYFGVEQNGVATKIAFQYDFADDTSDGSDISGHGSNVASIIAGNDGAYQGVAPGASLDDLRVYTSAGSGTFGYVQAALDWVIAHATQDHIAAVNLSLGDGGNWTTAVSRYGLGPDLASLAALDVIVVAAAGNAFYTFDSQPGVSYPASDPNVIGVGAVWDGNYGGPWQFASGATDTTTTADQIASFSQRSNTLVDTYAPGARLTGANATGGSVTMQGTSQAAAFISGVATLAQDVALGELGRLLTPTEFATLLQTSGDSIIDDSTAGNVTTTGASVPRVDVEKLATMILGLSKTAPVVPGGGGTTTPSITLSAGQSITLTAGEALGGIDFGNFEQGSISGTVFDDTNASGTKDTGEAGLQGRTVFLDTNHNGVLDTGETSTVTGAGGTFSFSHLGPGTYTVAEVLPAGSTATTPERTIALTSGLAATAVLGAEAPPTLTTLVDDTGVVGDGITKDSHVEVAGTAALGTTVRLYDSNGTTLLGTGIANATTGHFDITASVALADGPHSLTVKATNLASGITSAASAPLAVTVDTLAPTAASGPVSATATTLAFAVVFSQAPGPLTIADFAVVATGTAAGTVTSVSVSGATATVTLDALAGSGTLALALSPTSTAADPAGNKAILTQSLPATIAVDGTTLTASFVTAGGDKVTLVDTPDATRTRTVHPNGTASVTVTGVTGQPYTAYTLDYDAEGRLASGTNSTGETDSYSYNADGSYTVVSTGISGKPYTGSTVQYGKDGKPTGAIYSNGQTTTWTYHDGDTTIAYAGLTGLPYTSYSQTFGPDGTLISSSYSNGLTGTASSDPGGGHTVSYTGVTGKPYTSYSQSYDAEGRLVGATNSTGETVTYTYAQDGSYTVHYADVTGEPYTSATAHFSAAGKPLDASFSNGETITWTYGSDGTTTITHAGLTGGHTSVTQIFAANGALTRVSYGGLTGQPYTSYYIDYGPDGRATGGGNSTGETFTTTDKMDGTTEVDYANIPGEPYTSSSMTYGADGKPVSATYSNGVTVTWTYLQGGGVTITRAGITGLDYTSVAQTYAADGTLRSATYAGITGKPYTTYTVTYGAGGRISSSTNSTGVVATYTYNQDDSYQIAYTNVTGQPYISDTVQYNAAGKPTSAIYSNGRTITYTYHSDGSYEVDVKNPQGQTTKYFYDANGHLTGTGAAPAQPQAAAAQAAPIEASAAATTRRPILIDTSRKTADAALPTGSVFAGADWHKDVLTMTPKTAKTISITLPRA